MNHIFLDFFQSLYPTYFTQYNQSRLFKEMRLCGWTPTPQQSQPQPQKLYIHPQSQTYSQQGNIKISVKMPETCPQQQQKIQIRFNQQSPSIKPLNQTLPTSTINTSSWDQQQYQHSVQVSPVRQRKNSIIDCVSDDTMFKSSHIGGNQHARTSFSRDHAEYGIFRSHHTPTPLSNPPPKTPQLLFQSPHPTPHSTPHSSQALPPSYTQLLKQNTELKRIINEEYIPLKSIYTKLKQEQQDRQYLVSKLQWKVKQLAKEIKNKQF